jgi:hypothetical protein
MAFRAVREGLKGAQIASEEDAQNARGQESREDFGGRFALGTADEFPESKGARGCAGVGVVRQGCSGAGGRGRINGLDGQRQVDYATAAYSNSEVQRPRLSLREARRRAQNDPHCGALDCDLVAKLPAPTTRTSAAGGQSLKFSFIGVFTLVGGFLRNYRSKTRLQWHSRVLQWQ